MWLGPVKHTHNVNKSNLFYIQTAHKTTLWLNLGIQLKNRLAIFTSVYYRSRNCKVSVVTKLQYGCTRFHISSVWTNSSPTCPERHWRSPRLLHRAKDLSAPRIYSGADMSLARFPQYSVLFSADMTAQQSPQFNARVKKKWSFNSTPSNCLHVVYRNNFTVSFSLYYITRQCEYWRKHRRTAIDVANSSSTQSVLLRYNVASEDNRITDKQKPQLAAKNKRNHDVAEKDMHN